MISVHHCISDMIKYVIVVVANADVYYYDGGGRCIRDTSSGKANASADIGNITQAAIEYIKIIKNHNKPNKWNYEKK